MFLVVGAGFAGAVLARSLAEAGHDVTVLERRGHLGGNAFDYVNQYGERIHCYGPHLLHGAADCKAVRWMSRFTDWVSYEHRVRALLADGSTTPLPVNRTTLEDVFGVSLNTDAEAEDFLNALRVPIDKPANSGELFLSTVGERLTDIFFRPYTQKMWGVPPESLAVGIGARLPVRTCRDDRYFTDSFQALPLDGYAAMFERIYDHPRIKVFLNTPYSKGDEAGFEHAFLSVPIDHFFDCIFGELPYRSILFEERVSSEDLPSSVLNFTDCGPHTRVTQWSLLPNSGRSVGGGVNTLTYERPCAMSDNPGEFYYPVQTPDSRRLLARYQDLAAGLSNITFCGRTGLFRYLDMIPAVTLHLDMVESFLLRLCKT